MISELFGQGAMPELQGGSGGGDTLEWVHFAFRWFHIWFGIIWIGHLYFFNFVNANTMPKLDGPTKKAVVPQLMPRALFWFRWGAAVTWITGIVLFTLLYMMGSKYFWEGAGESRAISGRGWWITVGLVFGTVMAFNVWFIIWPKQKVIIAATRDGKAGEPDVQAKVKTATLASKVNTYLSVPLIASMLSNHFPTILLANWIWSIPLIVVIGFAFVWHWYKIAPKVQGF
jgi:uncharacterized membrane protein